MLSVEPKRIIVDPSAYFCRTLKFFLEYLNNMFTWQPSFQNHIKMVSFHWKVLTMFQNGLNAGKVNFLFVLQPHRMVHRRLLENQREMKIKDISHLSDIQKWVPNVG